MPRPDVLSKPPKFLRAPVARGLAAKADASEDLPAVDPTGGDYGAGIIRGMAVISRGEALGHDLWIDSDFMDQVTEAINASPEGVKARFTHPSLSGDGLGKFTGRVKNASIDGDVVRGDLHLSKLSHETPDGDLGGYILKLAKDDPTAFGNSIAFAHDWAAEEAFLIENGAQWKTGDRGDFLSLLAFESPDDENTENYPHARLASLRAVDAVDDPAANPNGLFHRGQEFATEAEALLSFGLGITDERPELVQFDIDPERFGAFVTRFLNSHGLVIQPKPKETHMSTTAAPATETAPKAPEAPPVVPVAPENVQANLSTATPVVSETPKATGEQFLAAFGDKGGVWFAQGKTFDEASKLHAGELKSSNELLAKENADLKKKLLSTRGEATPLSASPEPALSTAEQQDFKRLEQNLGTNLARFAIGNRISQN